MRYINLIQDDEKLKAMCLKIFGTKYEDETPFGKCVVKRALYLDEQLEEPNKATLQDA